MQERRDDGLAAEAVAAAMDDVAQVLAAHGEPLDLADRLVRHAAALLRADAVGLVVQDTAGRTGLLASTSDEARAVELFQLEAQQGPCVECCRTGLPGASPDAADMRRRWPDFARTAAELGINAVHTVPLTATGRTIGALNLFLRRPGVLSPAQADVARALASFGAVGLSQLEHVAESRRVQAQLQEALDSRIVLEQAKGVLAERHGTGPEEAFDELRRHARRSRRRLRDVAQEVLDDLSRVAPPPVG
ncbi:GAF and ANTAR domain-containing protein [Kineococcus rubinsiae]|uniref:GAF and ANTAR domain-containing protein n=1 Tax=Kineococcus rubinsiae TaxID=2609562 RepID=UPI001430F3DA|nr:GAF and ANTAR domain-containing protein [Kineococcus rubinsiae]NIZ89465.1 GAF and ANTAR domain-containing protein [Kineococcus rubinsiae]